MPGGSKKPNPGGYTYKTPKNPKPGTLHLSWTSDKQKGGKPVKPKPGKRG